MVIALDNLKDCTTRLELWQRLIDRIKPTTMLELGVWKGEFAAHILSHCPTIERYYMIDPWRTLPSWNKPLNVETANFEEIYRTAMAATQFVTQKLTVLRGTTREVIDRIPDLSLDLAYVDGDHTLRGIAIDLINIYPKIKQGGILAGDDFNANHWQHGPSFEPTLVFPFAIYFAEAVGAKITALPCDQFIIEKSLSAAGTFEFCDLTSIYRDVQLRGGLAQGKSTTNIFRKLIETARRIVK